MREQPRTVKTIERLAWGTETVYCMYANDSSEKFLNRFARRRSDDGTQLPSALTEDPDWNGTHEWPELVYLTSAVASAGSFKGQKGRRALNCPVRLRPAAFILLLLLLLLRSSGRKTSEPDEGEKRGMKKKKKRKKNFSNLSC